VLIAIIPINFLYRGEINTAIAKSNFNLQDQATQSKFKEIEMKAINSTLNDPTYSLSCAMYLIQVGFIDEGFSVVKMIYGNDPRNLDAINALAITSEKLNNIPDAMYYREKMAKLDPWNALNYLALGKAYKAQGDLVSSNEMLSKIISFSVGDIGGPVAEQAKTELAS
jgi:tetratricopeptide (TPR) repeat protein